MAVFTIAQILLLWMWIVHLFLVVMSFMNLTFQQIIGQLVEQPWMSWSVEMLPVFPIHSTASLAMAAPPLHLSAEKESPMILSFKYMKGMARVVI